MSNSRIFYTNLGSKNNLNSKHKEQNFFLKPNNNQKNMILSFLGKHKAKFEKNENIKNKINDINSETEKYNKLFAGASGNILNINA